MLIFKGENTHNHVYFLLWKSVIKNPGYPKLVWGIFFFGVGIFDQDRAQTIFRRSSSTLCAVMRFEAFWKRFGSGLERFLMRFGAFWSVLKRFCRFSRDIPGRNLAGGGFWWCSNRWCQPFLKEAAWVSTVWATQASKDFLRDKKKSNAREARAKFLGRKCFLMVFFL